MGFSLSFFRIEDRHFLGVDDFGDVLIWLTEERYFIGHYIYYEIQSRNTDESNKMQ